LYSVSAKRAGLTAAAVSAALLIAACSSSSSSSSSAPTSTSPSASTSSSASSTSGSSSVPQISYTGLTNDFSSMKSLTSIAAAGKGNITVILPDTVSSTRYVEFDAPYLKDAFAAAGLSTSNYTVENALGSDATQLSMAQSAITKGATVLVVDPLDSGVGAHIESVAKAAGVKVIDYDRLTLGGSRSYYVSFNNVLVGTLLGDGLVNCVSAWGVKNPQVTVMHGATTDNNATLFATGYDAVLKPLFASGKWTDVSNPPGTWTPDVALSEFQQTYTAHKNINAALIHADRPRQHPVGLPVRHRLQADLRGGPGRRRARALPARQRHAAGQPGQRHDPGHHVQGLGPVGPAQAGVGDHREHELHGDRRQVRAGFAAVRGLLRRGLQGGWHLQLI
jgi:D-xylose transport system substrate-binding protein